MFIKYEKIFKAFEKTVKNVRKVILIFKFFFVKM